MQKQKNFEDFEYFIKYSNQYLNEEEKGWLRDYMDAGEEGLAFDLIVGFVLGNKVPLNKELYDWIQQIGSEAEKMNFELFSDWKKIKLS